MQDAADDIEASSEYLLNVIRETAPDLLHLNQYLLWRTRCRYSQDRDRAQRRGELVGGRTRRGSAAIDWIAGIARPCNRDWRALPR